MYKVNERFIDQVDELLDVLTNMNVQHDELENTGIVIMEQKTLRAVQKAMVPVLEAMEDGFEEVHDDEEGTEVGTVAGTGGSDSAGDCSRSVELDVAAD